MFADVITTVCDKVANSIGILYGPCIRVALHPTRQCTSRVYGPVRVMHTARTQPCAQAVPPAVFGPCARPCTQAVYMHGRVHGPYTAVYGTGCVHGRVHGCVRRRTRPCMYTGRAHVYTTVYTAGCVNLPPVHGPCTLNNN